MKEVLSIVEWAAEIGKYVHHQKFGQVLLVGIRNQCEENRNVMLNIKVGDEPEYFWVYDYETSRIAYTPNLYL